MPTPDRPHYTGPLRLLTSDLTVSAGETFTEAVMARTPPATRVGTTSQGVFADDMHRKLPNGWDFTVGNEDYIAPDGRNYEGPGIPPTTEVPALTPSSWLPIRRDCSIFGVFGLTRRAEVRRDGHGV
ncbi:S41 family peptidase [Pseudonocardia sp. Cha107L01]|uniref:S41 family peptidase n=1 Tax=Pseudonocardia sp. Cha107L01 TaxID=3457576 RepID=UPI00403ECBC7